MSTQLEDVRNIGGNYKRANNLIYSVLNWIFPESDLESRIVCKCLRCINRGMQKRDKVGKKAKAGHINECLSLFIAVKK
jgi:hypothetical protein